MNIPHASKRTEQLQIIIHKHGVKGYGIFWLLNEMIAEKPQYGYPMQPYWINDIALKTNIEPNEIKAVIETGLDYKLFTTDGKNLCSMLVNSEIERLEKESKKKPTTKTKKTETNTKNRKQITKK